MTPDNLFPARLCLSGRASLNTLAYVNAVNQNHFLDENVVYSLPDFFLFLPVSFLNASTQTFDVTSGSCRQIIPCALVHNPENFIYRRENTVNVSCKNRFPTFLNIFLKHFSVFQTFPKHSLKLALLGSIQLQNQSRCPAPPGSGIRYVLAERRATTTLDIREISS